MKNELEEKAPLITWEDYQKQFPPKEYEQSQKFGDYEQYIINHRDKLYVEWLKLKGGDNG